MKRPPGTRPGCAEPARSPSRARRAKPPACAEPATAPSRAVPATSPRCTQPAISSWLATLAILTLPATPAQAAARPDPRHIFNQAVTADSAASSPDGSARALALYREAADAGLPEAELNAAVMFDSGRGTPRNPALAADYYAAAAAAGLARAAFDLGQLYETGDGVPRNPALAQAWFGRAVSGGLQAAASRPAHPPLALPADMPSPVTRYPPDAATLPVPAGGVPLVWTAAPAPAPATYFVQVMQLEGHAAVSVFSTTTDTSAIRMPSPHPGHYAWRVFILCPLLGRYVPSGWAAFSLS